MSEPRDAELIIRDSDTVVHWIAVHRECIETSNAIAAAMDSDAPGAIAGLWLHPDDAGQRAAP